MKIIQNIFLLLNANREKKWFIKSFNFLTSKIHFINLHCAFTNILRFLLNKTLIVGVYEKVSNKLIVKVLKNANEKNLLKFALKHISTECCLFTDSWKGYESFKNFYFKHEVVNHQSGYVSPNRSEHKPDWISI